MKKKWDRGKSTLEQAIERELKALTNGRTPKPGAAEVIAPMLESASKPPGPARNWRLWSFLLLCLVGSAITSFIIFKYVAPTIPHELIGTWKVTDGPLKESTLEFRWYGTAIATENVKGKKEESRQSVKVVGNKILLTSRDDVTGKEDTVSQTILKLTEDELVLRDEDRRTYSMTRVRN